MLAGLFRRLHTSTVLAGRATAAALLDAVFPWSCGGCGVEGSSFLCAECATRIRWIGEPVCSRCGLPLSSGPSRPCGRCLARPPAFSRARSIAFYRAGADEENDPLGATIRALKYARRRCFAAALGEVLAARFPYAPEEFDLVVPVPLHRSRLRERGFNQALLIARGPAKRFGLPVEARALRRHRPTAPQVGLDETERRRNLREAFSVEAIHLVEGRRILVIDDVITSGATADACARALLSAGASRVDVLSLARTVLFAPRR
jgi:ComF family protein